MHIPVLNFGLAHYGSEPFNYTFVTATIIQVNITL